MNDYIMHNTKPFRNSVWVVKTLLLAFFCFTSFIVAKPSPNILLICVDDLRPELGCYGVDYMHTPNIDKLASKGRLFHRHYVNAPTCGASRYTLLTGQFKKGGRNNSLLLRAQEFQETKQKPSPSLPAHFRDHGYTTVSVGKVSHYPGGRGGGDWNHPAKVEMPLSWDRHLISPGVWKHPRGWMHGLANGEIRDQKNKRTMDVFQATAGDDSIYPDGNNTAQGVEQLQLLSNDIDKPFFLAVGILRPHLPFGAPKKYLDLYKNTKFPPIPHPKKPKGQSTWHSSGEFFRYNTWDKDPRTDQEFATEVRRHYAACVSYADAQVGILIDALEKSPAKDNTIVILWGDHGWNLGEHSIWGKHNLFEEALRSPLIITTPEMPNTGEITQQIVQTVDIFPTLCELSNLPAPDKIVGRSLGVFMKDPKHRDGIPAVGYNPKCTTLRSDQYRIIIHERNGHIELYDHNTPEAETRNIAKDKPELVNTLRAQLESFLK